MFSWFKKERTKSEKPKSSSTRYIYKPYENAMAFRVEYRDAVTYVYRGWSKNWAYRLEDNKIYAAGSEEACYIIIGNKVCNFSGEEILYRIARDSIYRASEKEACYIIKSSITVQGTL